MAILQEQTAYHLRCWSVEECHSYTGWNTYSHSSGVRKLSASQLSKRLWSDHGVRLETKLQVYRAAILSSLLYGSETWTQDRRHIKKLDNFHMKSLRRILNVQWQDRIPNTEILNRCKNTGVEVMIMQSHLRWCSHVHRMPDSRIPKQLLYGQLADSARSQGGQRKRCNDHLRLTLKSCDIS